ncbi:MAG: flavin reductase family protein [Leptospiraceae bacterium]|nr:flavin reductase family protein [Leptospiraceae bacterium]MCK6380508.1 flavin reductase family protein [Leptospiraceae bacterium]NUM42029.1 flavin reductase family protein [Leptospiraceae bacterium]
MNESIENFKNTLGQFATGVTVITYPDGDKFGGITVNSFSSLSLDPPLILVCLQKSISSHNKIQEAGVFAVNILEKSQENLSNLFASRSVDKNECVNTNGYTIEKSNSPILNGCTGFLDCKVENYVEGGDHSIVIGRVIACGSSPDKRPLLYYHRKYYSI